jgi:cold shock CspA family protein
LLDGYGFIQADDGSRYFFHRSALIEKDFNALKYGELCTFEVEEGDGRGPVALNVITYSEIEGE